MIRPGHLKGILVLGLIGLGFGMLWSGMAADQADWYVPVRIENLPSGRVAIRSHIKGIEIQVYGPRAVVQSLPNQKVEYRINLGGATPGIHAVVIDPKLIKLPKGLTIRGVNPSRFPVKIENEINRVLPVKITFQGEPASGFIITDTHVRPDSVVLVGPESILAPLTEIATKPVDVSGSSETFRKEIALDLAEELEVMSVSRLAMAEVTISEKVATKRMEEVPILGKNTRFRYRILPATAGIIVKGPARVVEKLDAVRDISVTVDLDGLAPGTYIRRASISLPIQATLISVAPEKFRITLTAR